MVKSLRHMYKASFISGANTLISVFSKMPLLGKHMKEDMYGKSKTGFGVAYIILKYLLEFIKKILFVLVFMFVPQMVFSKWMPTGATGFELENCYVYWGIVLCGFCGSVIKSEVFNSDENSFDMLKIIRVNPKNYFRMRILSRSLLEFPAFWLAFSVCGMNFVKAFYLTIVIILGRFAGETLNILIFRAVHKPFSDIRGTNVFVMLASLILAYFIPYIRGCVPAAYNLVFSTIWLPVILVAGSLFMYYVWNYRSYSKIAMRVYTEKYFEIEEKEPFTIKESVKEVVEESEYNVEKLSESGDVSEYAGKMFFQKNIKLIKSGIITRILIILGIFIVAIVVSAMDKRDIIYKVISYSMPVLVFIMYVMSRGRILCRELFYGCDYKLMKAGYYKDREFMFQSFMTRLKYIALIDIIPAAFLAFVYLIAGVLAGREGSAVTVVSVCVGILVLSLIFSVYNIFMYYLCMPFSENEEYVDKNVGSIMYRVVNIGMYVGCYFCIFIETTSLYFTLVVALIFAVLLAVSATIIAFNGHKTFRIKS